MAALIRDHGQKGPLRVVEGIAVERMHLGSQPPQLHTVCARSVPSQQQLLLECGVSFTSGDGFRIVVRDPARAPCSVAQATRLEPCDLPVICPLTHMRTPEEGLWLRGILCRLVRCTAWHAWHACFSVVLVTA